MTFTPRFPDLKSPEWFYTTTTTTTDAPLRLNEISVRLRCPYCQTVHSPDRLQCPNCGAQSDVVLLR